MSELEEKLENILGNPQAMAQIMSLAQSLNGGGSPPPAGTGEPSSAQEQASPAPAPAPSPPPPASGGAGDGLGGLLGGLGSLDPKLLSAAAGLLGQFNSGGDDQRVALLTALRPFVKEQRYAKLDKAIQIAKLSRLIRSGLELFRAQREAAHGEGDSHV